MSDLKGNKDELVKALLEWWGDRQPTDPGDARLMQALWRYNGDQVEPCPECDGKCDEPCAPRTVEQACAELDRYIDDWDQRHGITRVAVTHIGRAHERRR